MRSAPSPGRRPRGRRRVAWPGRSSGRRRAGRAVPLRPRGRRPPWSCRRHRNRSRRRPRRRRSPLAASTCGRRRAHRAAVRARAHRSRCRRAGPARRRRVDRRRTARAAGRGAAICASSAIAARCTRRRSPRNRAAARSASAVSASTSRPQRRRSSMRRPRVVGSAVRSGRSPSTSTPLTTTGRQLDADAVLDRERRLDRLVDRRRLGERDEGDLAAGGVAEHLQHVVGLRPHGTAATPRRGGPRPTSAS